MSVMWEDASANTRSLQWLPETFQEAALDTSVALVHPYWDFFEDSVPFDLRAERTAMLHRVAEVVSEAHDVVASLLISCEAEARAAVKVCAAADALVLLSSMASPPGPTMELLDQLAQHPVVVWAMHESADPLPGSFSHSDITARGATVGAPMLTSAIFRSGRHCDVVLAPLSSPHVALEAIRRAAAAGRTRRSTILRIGAPIPGYTMVDASDEMLAALGPRVRHVEPDELRERSAAVTHDQLAERETEVRHEFDVNDAIAPGELERALRVEIALDELVVFHQAAAGSLNCHLPAIRYGSTIGIAPCLALGRLTSRGIPWACAGDVVTAVAMLTVQSLGHPTMYHEIEAVDYERDELVLANSGEHDLRLCGHRRPRLVPNVWYRKDPRTGPCALFTIPAGPASLTAFVFGPKPRFIVANGHFTGHGFPHTGIPNAGFRFGSGRASTVWPKWAAAGATHHSVATSAQIAGDIAAVAAHLNCQYEQV